MTFEPRAASAASAVAARLTTPGKNGAANFWPNVS